MSVCSLSVDYTLCDGLKPKVDFKPVAKLKLAVLARDDTSYDEWDNAGIDTRSLNIFLAIVEIDAKASVQLVQPISNYVKIIWCYGLTGTSRNYFIRSICTHVLSALEQSRNSLA